MWSGLAVFGGLLALCFVFLLVVISVLDPERGEAGWGAGRGGAGRGPRIGVVEVRGVIDRSRELLGQLHTLRNDPTIAAIVVRIDSPGGAVAPSQELHQAILRARKTKKVVCSMGTVAASGGYYIAAACDRIVASAGTITGSIGVISQFPHLHRLLDLAKIDVDVLKSGAKKDVGSPFRAMDASEKSYFQALIDDIHTQFIEDVARGRGLDPKTVRVLADGRVFTGQQALAVKLVDELGTLEDALDVAARLAGHDPAKTTPIPVWQKRPGRGLLGELVEGAARTIRDEGAPTVEVRDPRL
jgi:protease-4